VIQVAEVIHNTPLDQLNKEYSKPDTADRIRRARARANYRTQWCSSRGLANQEGELLLDGDNRPMTLLDISNSWYDAEGLRNNVRAIRHRCEKALHHGGDVRHLRPKLITLTFRDATESWENQEAIQHFTDTLRTYSKRHGCCSMAYFWIAEVQQARRALHYHIMVLGSPFLPKERLVSWWPHGFVDARVCDSVGRCLEYMLKELQEMLDAAKHNGGFPDWWYLFSVFRKRRYGFSAWFRLPLVDRIPAWLRKTLACSEELVAATRAKGGGWNLTVKVSGTLIQRAVAPLWKVMKLPRMLRNK